MAKECILTNDFGGVILTNKVICSKIEKGIIMIGTNKEFLDFLLERFRIERKKFDRSGVYAYTQRLLAYNSNKIEGSTLTEEQTASLFDNGMLPKSDDYYRAKDVEEMNGHFLMFNKMLDTLNGSPVHSTQFIPLRLLTASITKSGRIEGCAVLLCGRIARI